MKLSRGKLIVIILLSIILVVIVLNSTVFTIQKVDVQFENQTKVYSSSDSAKLIAENSISLGQNIIFASKKDMTNIVERKNAYAKVINIEKVFPNKIIIHIIEREPVFCVSMQDSRYAILDGDLKVLDVKDIKGTLIDLSFLTSISTLSSGEFLSIEGNNEITSILTNFEVYSWNNATIQNKFKTFSLDKTNKNNESLLNLNITTYQGVNIRFNNIDKDLKTKVYNFIEFYSGASNDGSIDLTKGTINVYDITLDKNVVYSE
jgi:hypothetical protein